MPRLSRLTIALASIALSLLGPTAYAQDVPEKPAAAADAGEAKAEAKPAEAKGDKGDKDDKDDKDDAKPTHKGKAAPVDEDGIPLKHEPVTVTVDIELESLSKFDLGSGSYNAEFVMTVHCDKEPCDPALAIGNGKELGKPEKISDDPLEKRYRVKAELDAFIDLSNYPYDSHELTLELYEKTDPLQTKLKVGVVEANERIRLPGWDIGSAESTIAQIDAGEKDKQDQYTLSIDVHRPKLPQTFKSLVPVFFMVFVAAVGLFLRPKSINLRFGAATGGLVPLVMFHVGQINSLPAVGYLTKLDKFMVASYLVFVVHIAFNTLILRSEEVKTEDKSARLYKLAGIAVPASALAFWLAVLFNVV